MIYKWSFPPADNSLTYQSVQWYWQKLVVWRFILYRHCPKGYKFNLATHTYILGFDLINQLWLTLFTSKVEWTSPTCRPEGYNMMEPLNYSSQSLNIYAHHTLASWKLYTWNLDTIYQVPAIETSATKATVCIVHDCIGSVWFPCFLRSCLLKHEKACIPSTLHF